MTAGASQHVRSTIMLDKLMLLRCPNVDMAVQSRRAAGMADAHHHPLAETEEDR